MELKLAAILYADVVGYGRLVGSDEKGTHPIFQAHFDALSATTEGHTGRIIITAGDPVLEEFGSVVSALKCAVTAQREMAERNKGLSGDRKLQFRIGANFGDTSKHRPARRNRPVPLRDFIPADRDNRFSDKPS